MDTSHPGYGKCRLHFGNTPRGCAQAACAEAIALSGQVARSMGFSAEGDPVWEVRVLEGAVEYTQLRVRQGTGTFADWVTARVTLVNRLAKARNAATRSGVSELAGREITRDVMRPHLGSPAPLRLSASSVAPEPAVRASKSAARVMTDAALRKLFTDAKPSTLKDQNPPEGEAP